MFGFLAQHFFLSGAAGLAVLAFVAVGLLGGWPLVLNRYGLGALTAALVIVGLALGWQYHADVLRAEGAAELAAANQRALDERRTAISQWVVAKAEGDAAAFEQRRLMEQRIDAERDQWKKDSHVSKAADAACSVPVGFVFDHDRAVPGPGGHPAVPAVVPADADRRSDVSLSSVGGVVSSNYAECRKLIGRVETAERKRYQECLAYDKKFGTVSGCAP